MIQLLFDSAQAIRRLGLVFLIAGCADAQLSSSAYRVLGQPDLRQRGVNILQNASLFAPGAVALDQRGPKIHLYVADTTNSRVLAWEDVQNYQTGDPPALILGQPGPAYSAPLGIGAKGFNQPLGMGVDPKTGNLYVADTRDHRVLRFPSPFDNLARIDPDAVYGQSDFNTRTANSSGVTASTMNSPHGVAFDSAGNLWVADSGNNRVLRFAATTLDNVIPPASDTVIGQKGFSSNSPNSGSVVSASGFDFPGGIAFDSQDNLYVADYNNTRVLKFPAPLGPNNASAAALVFGEPDFTTHGVPGQASSSTLNHPAGIAVDQSGRLYVAAPNDNRVLVFSSAGGAAVTVLGQSDFVSTKPNANVSPQASPNALSGPFDVRVDGNGNVYVADTGNNRLVSFPPNSKSAVQVWGQNDFASNGVNQIKPGSMNSPYKVAIDYSQTPFALYVSDTSNDRVLVWKDVVSLRSGDAADLVVGQPDLRTGVPNVDTHGSANPSSTSLDFPQGIVVDGAGNLWVADSGNNRVLRYPRPVSQGGRITPDIVIGQADFTSSASAAVNGSSLRGPTGLALGPDGNLFVADTGNNRVLEFAAGARTNAAAIRVYGQSSLTSAGAPFTPSPQTLSAPQGVFVDSAFNLYIADTGANRVLIIPNTQVAAPAGTPAAFVIGQGTFSSSSGGSGTNLQTPSDVALDSSGNIYVSDSSNNRVLVFPSLIFLPVFAGTATAVVGQANLTGRSSNWDSTDSLATADSLSTPLGIYLDRRDTLYVGDSGNNRALHFLKAASAVNVAHYQGGIPVSLGGLAALFGIGLTDASDGPASPPFPTTMLNRQVVINETIPAPLFGITKSQVNFQMPSGAPLGTNRIAVRLADTGELVAGGGVLVAAASPGLFTLSQDGKGQAAALNQDGTTVNGPSNPAARGSLISLFGTGQGQVSPAVPDGNGAPGNPLAYTVAVPTADSKACLTTQPSICVLVGSGLGNIQFSGLAPNYVGLWQLNVQIPQDAATGSAIPVRAIINGTASNTVTVAIR
jgi:uncharacterized protein (TIGR03437 family)